MTTESTITNEQVIESKESEQEKTSLLKTTVWLVVIIFLPQLVLGFGFGMFFGILQGSDYTAEAFDLWFMSMPVLLTLSLISPILSIPLLIIASREKGKKKSYQNLLVFCSINSINRKDLGKWLSIGLLFWICSSLLGELLNLPIEQFMLDVKAANNSFAMLTLILTTICVVAPIMEELTFRGWLYSKIKLTKLGNIGALIITSVIFTVIHTQYDNPVTLVFLFSLGLLLGFVRYKTNNISYAIAIHILFNSLAMGTLFLFGF